jgi:Taurine catabolism dioxygenase TauD, TfdA family
MLDVVKDQKLMSLVIDRSAWTVADLERDPTWTYHLTAEHLKEIDAAVKAVNAKGLPPFGFEKADFSLPTLGPDLERMQDELENGCSFVVISRVPVENYSVDDARRIIWGMGRYWGTPISQNARGELLCSVIDQGREYGATGRGYQTSARLDFHCDNSDIVALMFVKKSKSGGSSLLVSAMSIYNEILTNHPEYLDALYRGFHYDLRGEGRPEVGPHTGHRIPVFSYLDGKLSCRFVRNGIELGAKSSGNPLTEKDLALLDLIDEISRRPDLCLKTDFEPGDIQVVNNHSTLHARTDFEDYPEPERRRHALRLWLNLLNGRPLTYEFSNRYGPNSGRLGVPPVEKPPEHIAKS